MSAHASSEAPPRLPKICFVVSAALTADAFLGDHIAALSKHYEVHLAANAGHEAMTHEALRRAIVHRIPVVRTISPWSDIRAIAKLTALLRRERFRAVHSLTPKAGLVSALAGFLARVPVRIHTFTGQVWATRSGAGRAMLKGIDRAIATLNTHILVDSVSQRDFLRDQKVRPFVLDIETDSTIQPDEQAEKQARTEFMQAFIRSDSADLKTGSQFDFSFSKLIDESCG